MGMFDSLLEPSGREWQTKAFDCALDAFRIGDTIPADMAATYQVEVCGGDRDAFRWSLATVRDNVLTALDEPRDPTLPLVGYGGALLSTGSGL